MNMTWIWNYMKKNSVRPTEIKVFVYKYIYIKNRWFVKAMNLKILSYLRSPILLQLERMENMLELLGILGTFKRAEHPY